MCEKFFFLLGFAGLGLFFFFVDGVFGGLYTLFFGWFFGLFSFLTFSALGSGARGSDSC